MAVFWDVLKAIAFGIVEGITEWLPISSTGHLILLEQFLKMDVSENYMEMFDVVIQLGAIFAVVLLFWKRLWPFGYSRGKGLGGVVFPEGAVPLWAKILISCVPAAVVGILWDDVFNALFYNPVSVAIALIAVGGVFILLESRKANKAKEARVRRVDDIAYWQALAIGVFQVLAAVFPGTSRSGATIMGALLIGLSRRTAAEYSFLLAVPVMFGASLLKLVKFGFAFTGTELLLLAVGMIVSFVVSLFVIGFLMDYIRKHDFKVFGWYRIALGAVVLIAAAAGVFK